MEKKYKIVRGNFILPLKSRYQALPKRRHQSLITGFSGLTIALFLLGFIAGNFGGHLFKDHLYNSVLLLFENTLNNLSTLEINGKDVFLYSLKENLKIFFLLVFFAMTNVWRFYYAGFTLYTGFSQGLFCSFCMILSGAGGFVQYLFFLLPQSLLLAPVFLLCICHLEDLHCDLFSSENSDNSKGILQNAKKRQLIISKLPLLLICIVLLTAGALLEGYLNIPLLKYI
jgi:hypothetical protein